MDNNNLMETEGNHKTTIKSESPENLNQLCRVCAKTSDHMIPIFNNDLHHNLSAKINEYLPITILENDTLPLQLCYTCAIMVLAWHDLLEGCSRAQQKLLQIQADTKTQLNKVHMTPFELQTQNEVIEASVKIELETEEYQNQPSNERINDQITNEEKCNNSIVNTVEYQTTESINIMKNNNISNIKDLMRRAQIVINGQTFYHCKKCRKNFSTQYLFCCHLKSHIREKSHECHICKQQFSLKHNLTRHVNKTHAKIKKLICDVCNKMCDYRERMNSSEQVCTTGRPFVCESCKYTCQTVFTSSTIYNKIETEDEDCPIQCMHCKKFLPTKSSLRFHMVEHTGETSDNQARTITK